MFALITSSSRMWFLSPNWFQSSGYIKWQNIANLFKSFFFFVSNATLFLPFTWTIKRLFLAASPLHLAFSARIVTCSSGRPLLTQRTPVVKTTRNQNKVTWTKASYNRLGFVSQTSAFFFFFLSLLFWWCA